MQLRAFGLLAPIPLGGCAADPPVSPTAPAGIAAAKGGTPAGNAGGDPACVYTLHDLSWAHAVNDAGHIAGRCGRSPQGGTPRAVVWCLEADGAAHPPLDLTADSADSGDNHAVDVTEPVDGGIRVSGCSTLANQTRATVWKADVVQRQVVERIRSPLGTGRWINAMLDVVIMRTRRLEPAGRTG